MSIPVTLEAEYQSHVSSAESRGASPMSKEAFFSNKQSNGHIANGLPYGIGITQSGKRKKQSWKN